jgi:hypothetical protein
VRTRKASLRTWCPSNDARPRHAPSAYTASNLRSGSRIAGCGVIGFDVQPSCATPFADGRNANLKLMGGTHSHGFERTTFINRPVSAMTTMRFQVLRDGACSEVRKLARSQGRDAAAGTKQELKPISGLEILELLPHNANIAFVKCVCTTRMISVLLPRPCSGSPHMVRLVPRPTSHR